MLLEQLRLPTLSAGGTKLHGLKAEPTQLCWSGTSRQVPLGLRALCWDCTGTRARGARTHLPLLQPSRNALQSKGGILWVHLNT